jgi:hypothetical protein
MLLGRTGLTLSGVGLQSGGDLATGVRGIDHGADGAANVIFRRQIKDSEDPAATRAAKIEEYRNAFNTPYTHLVLPSAFFAQQGMTPCFLAGRD